ALEVGQHQRHGLGRTGGGGDDVQGRGTGATRVLVRAVLQHLVRGVGVHRGHQALDDAELLVQHLRYGGEYVGCAGGVVDDVVRVGVVVALVDTDHEGRVLVLRLSGDDDLLGAVLDVGLGLLGVGEDAGGLDDDV